MPLLNRQPYELGPRVPPNIKPSDELFVVRVTGEAVATYEEYLAKLNLYRNRTWVDMYSGKGGLTYEEALLAEQKASEALAKQLAKVPDPMQEAVVQQIQHSTMGLEALITSIYDAHKPAPKNAGKENEPEDKGSSGPHPLKSKAFIRSFIVEVADRTHGVWFVKPAWVQKYQLSGDMSEAARLVYEHFISAKKGSRASKSGAAGTSSSAAPSPSTAGRKRESTGQTEGAAAGGATAEAQPKPAPRTLEEEEAKLREGTMKWAVFHVLKRAAEGSSAREAGAEEGAAGPSTQQQQQQQQQQGQVAGMTVDEIIQAATAQGLKSEWGDNGHKNLASALVRDATFCRVAKGRYTLRALPGVVPLDTVPRPPKASKEGTGTTDSPAEAAGKQQKTEDEAGPSKGKKKAAKAAAAAGAAAADAAANGVREGSAAPPTRPLTQEEEDAAAVARAEVHLKQAKAAAERRAKALTAAEASLASLKQQLEAAQAAAREQRKAERDAERRRRLSGQHSAGGTPEKGTPENGTPAPGEGPSQGNGGLANGDNSEEFQLPPELQKYQGDEDDRKALIAWRRARAEAEKKLQQQRERALQERRLSEARQKAGSSKAVTELQAAIAKAQEACEGAAAQAGKATKAVADAERALEREKQRGALRAAKDNAKAEREKLKQAEKEERERRRQEALKAKRYPIDDTQLLQELEQEAAEAGAPPPAQELPLPSSWMAQTQSRRLADALYVADFLGQFGKALGVKGATYQELEEMLSALPLEQQAAEQPAGASAKATVEQADKALAWLSGAYQGLLVAILTDGEDEGAVGRLEGRWAAGARSKGAWPEVLRRYMAARAEGSAESGRAACVVDTEGAVAGATLAAAGPGALAAQQHLLLLRFLADEALDTEAMRNLLSQRMEGAADVAAEIRSEMAEERRKLRELVEAEREGRKRKRAHALALATAAAERQLAEQGASAAGDAADGEAPDAKKAKLAQRMLAQLLKGDGGDGGDSSDEEEPAWELPPELHEYTGDTGDRKAVTAWRQQQQAAKQKLEKDKARWEAQRRKKLKDKEARRKAEAEEEKKKAKERAAAEEALAEKQEALDRELERFAIRRVPLGHDRSHRAYWWGLGGHKSAVLVAKHGEGRNEVAWGAIEDEGGLEGLMEVLDVRGFREKELKGALEKAHASIQTAMRKAAAARAPPADDTAAPNEDATAAGPSKAPKRAKIKGIPPERVLPSRHARAVAEESIKATSATGAAAAAAAAKQREQKQQEQQQADAEMAEADEAGVLVGWEGEALAGACHDVAQLATSAAAARMQGPPGGWAAWRRKLLKLLAGEVDKAWEGDAGAAAGDDVAAVVLSQLRARLLETEGYLFAGCADAKYNRGRKRDQQEGQQEGHEQQEEEEEEDEESSEEEEGDEEDEQEEADAAPMDVDPAPANGKKRGRGDKQAASPAVEEEDKVEDAKEEQQPGRRRHSRSRKVAAQQEAGAGEDGSKGAGDDEQDDGGSGGDDHDDGDERGGSQRAQGRRLSVGHHHVARLLQKMGEPDEEVWSEDDSTLPDSARRRCIWRSAAERSSWRACVAAASTPALVAYCAAALAHHAAGPLEVLVGKGQGGKKRRRAAA